MRDRSGFTLGSFLPFRALLSLSSLEDEEEFRLGDFDVRSFHILSRAFSYRVFWFSFRILSWFIVILDGFCLCLDFVPLQVFMLFGMWFTYIWSPWSSGTRRRWATAFSSEGIASPGSTRSRPGRVVDRVDHWYQISVQLLSSRNYTVESWSCLNRVVALFQTDPKLFRGCYDTVKDTVKTRPCHLLVWSKLQSSLNHTVKTRPCSRPCFCTNFNRVKSAPEPETTRSRTRSWPDRVGSWTDPSLQNSTNNTVKTRPGSRPCICSIFNRVKSSLEPSATRSMTRSRPDRVVLHLRSSSLDSIVSTPSVLKARCRVVLDLALNCCDLINDTTVSLIGSRNLVL